MNASSNHTTEEEDDGYRQCRECGEPLYLRDECEWPDDPAEILCDTCQAAELAKVRQKLQRAEELCRELAESMSHYFATYKNEGKENGWCKRLAAASERVNSAIRRAEELTAKPL